MTEDTAKTRASYGVIATDMKFKTSENRGGMPEVDDSYEGLTKNPANTVLAHFYKIFLRNEQLSESLVTQLNEQLELYYKKISEDVYYSDMDIIKLVNDILNKFQNCMSSMRNNIFISKETVDKLLLVIKDNYVTKQEFEDFKEEAREILKEETTGQLATVHAIQGERRIELAPYLRDLYNDGDRVRINKIRKEAKI